TLHLRQAGSRGLAHHPGFSFSVTSQNSISLYTVGRRFVPRQNGSVRSNRFSYCYEAKINSPAFFINRTHLALNSESPARSGETSISPLTRKAKCSRKYSRSSPSIGISFFNSGILFPPIHSSCN